MWAAAALKRALPGQEFKQSVDDGLVVLRFVGFEGAPPAEFETDELHHMDDVVFDFFEHLSFLCRSPFRPLSESGVLACLAASVGQKREHVIIRAGWGFGRPALRSAANLIRISAPALDAHNGLFTTGLTPWCVSFRTLTGLLLPRQVTPELRPTFRTMTWPGRSVDNMGRLRLAASHSYETFLELLGHICDKNPGSVLMLSYALDETEAPLPALNPAWVLASLIPGAIRQSKVLRAKGPSRGGAAAIGDREPGWGAVLAQIAQPHVGDDGATLEAEGVLSEDEGDAEDVGADDDESDVGGSSEGQEVDDPMQDIDIVGAPSDAVAAASPTRDM